MINLEKNALTGKYKIKINASAWKESSCYLRIYRIIVEGYKEKLRYNDTQYGSAFHLFISELHKTKGNFAQSMTSAISLNEQPAIQRTNRNHLTSAHLVKVCTEYTKHFQKQDTFEILTVDGEPLVEQQFSILYYEDDLFEVYLEGTIDAIGKFTQGVYAIRDYKTRSLWATRGKDGSTRYVEEEIRRYFKQYELSLQLRFYLFCIKLFGQKHPNTPLGKLFTEHRFGVFIEGIFTSSQEFTKFAKSEVFLLEQSDLDEFQGVFDIKLRQFLSLVRMSIEYDKPYTIRDGIVSGSCYENKYPCKFAAVCAAQKEIARTLLLQNEFKQQLFDPLHHDK